MVNKIPKINLYLNQSQINGMLHVLDSYISLNENDKMITHAKQMKKKIYDYCKTYYKEGEEHFTLLLYESESAIITKLMATFVDAVFDIDKDYCSDIKNYQSEKSKSSQSDDFDFQFNKDKISNIH